MRSWTIAFSLGIFLLLNLPRLPHHYYFILAIIVIVFAIVCYCRTQQFILLCLIGVLAGFGWAYLTIAAQLSHPIPTELTRGTVLVEGTVTSIPTSFEFGERFSFMIHASYLAKYRHIQLNVRLASYKQAMHFHPGQTWQFSVRLKRAHSFANPGSFDYAKWLFAQHIQATGYIVASDNNKCLSQSSWHYPIAQFRLWLSHRLDQYSQQPSTIGLINALLIGDKQAVSNQQLLWFRQTGTSHLLAISGLHIGMVAGWCYFLMLLLWRRSAALCLYWPAPKAAALASIVGAISYSLLAGLSIPTQRAMIMIAVLVFAKLNNRSLLDWHAWCFALLLVLLHDPLSMLSAGFYLSFMAVACLIYTTSNRLSATSFYWRYVRPQMGVVIGLMPLSLWFFGQSSLLGFIANSVAIPLVSFIIVPLILIAALSLLISTSLAQFALYLASLAIKLLLAWLAYLSSYQQFIWHYTMASHIALYSCYLSVALLLAPTAWPGRFLGFFCLLPVIYYPYPRLTSGQYSVTLLDVGQGLSVVIRTRQHVLLYDTGPKFSENFDAGSAIVLPYLFKNNIHRIDRVVISHGDNDHIGGLAALQSHILIKDIFSSVPAKIKKQPAQLCLAGQHWQWDGVSFLFLYPNKKQLGLNNDSSCVLKISNGVKSVLLTGDIEKLAEKVLLKTQYSHLPATVLIVPHHGSTTSSTTAFIHAIHPQYAWFAVGYRNRYGLPKPKVITRYLQAHVALFDTVKSGAISMLLTKDVVANRIQQYRVVNHHLWD